MNVLSLIRPVSSGQSVAAAATALLVLVTACAPTSDPVDAPSEPPSDSPITSDAVGPPPEAIPENADPEIAAQLERLIADVQTAPDEASRRAALGMAYEVAGLLASAETCYRQAARLEPGQPRWPYFLALTLGAQGKLASALEALDAVTALDASYVSSWLYRGRWLLDLGETAEARDAYRRATELDPDSNAGWIGVARCELKLGDHARAIEILEDVAPRYRHPQVYQLLGLAYRDSGDLESARAALAKGRPGPPPRWPDAWSREKGRFLAGFGAGLMRAEALLSRGRAEEAITLLEGLRETHPDDVALLNNLSIAYGQTGDEAAAVEVLRQGLKANPGYYPFHLNLSNRYYRRGDVTLALEHLDRAIELNPTLGWAYQQKATFLRETGRLREAQVAIDKGLKLDATSARWFLYASQIDADLGDWAGAVERAEQAVGVDPSSATAYLMLGRAQIELGDRSAAERSLERAQRLGADPNLIARLRRKMAGS